LSQSKVCGTFFLMNLLNYLKLQRVKSGDLTQDQLAKLVSCSRQTISSIEKGRFKPSVELALKLANVLNCKVEDIFKLEDESNE
jgi:putative transcriptional regulator